MEAGGKGRRRAQETRDRLEAHILDQAHLGREVLFTQLPDYLVKGKRRPEWEAKWVEGAGTQRAARSKRKVRETR